MREKSASSRPACGARTRKGGTCKNRVVRFGRCRMHGGASLSGHSHPRFKHGRYSECTLEGRLRRAEVEQRKRMREHHREFMRLYKAALGKARARGREDVSLTAYLSLIRQASANVRERRAHPEPPNRPAPRRRPRREPSPAESAFAHGLLVALGPAVMGLREARDGKAVGL